MNPKSSKDQFNSHLEVYLASISVFAARAITLRFDYIPAALNFPAPNFLYVNLHRRSLPQ
jgi:hypothetical protein